MHSKRYRQKIQTSKDSPQMWKDLRDLQEQFREVWKNLMVMQESERWFFPPLPYSNNIFVSGYNIKINTQNSENCIKTF